MASQEDKTRHWVEDVFPPTFGYTAKELYERDVAEANNLDNEVELMKNFKDKSPSVYDIVARRISPLDATEIKNVYERVWLMTAMEEEERKQRAENGEESKRDKQLPSTEKEQLSIAMIRESAVKSTGLHDLKASLHEKMQDTKQVDIEDMSLWNSSEIEILREVFKETKRQNAQLKAILRTNQEYLRKLERKFKKQSSVLELRTDKLQEARKANERLQIAGDNFKQQLSSASKTIEFLHEEIKSLRESQSKLTKETQNLRLELDKERIDRKNTQFDLISQQQAATREMELREEKLKLLHSEDVDYLQNQIESLTNELEKEKTEHQRSLKGLQHLRNHFSSVPLAGDVSEISKKANVINTDQLKKLTL